jgi:hypothetical protein
MRTSLLTRRVESLATRTPNEPHPIDEMVDALSDRASAVTDPRLKQLLLRAACTVVDRVLASKS